MSNTREIYVRPARRDVPVNRGQYRLPVEGARVPDDLYWRRRLHHGDVAMVAEAEAPKDAPKTEPKAASRSKGAK
jgi:hypothetical protein